ncbi:MAG: hypothetical protein LBK72_06985 [Bifidobacteriaceae bacterium]|jgi:hypothetical protein|nr:hypothetical protein [Bifidobacteriaceae bacterium]
MSHATTTLAAAAIVGLALSLAGCAGSGNADVPTLRRDKVKETSASSTQRQGAEALYACLKDAKLPAKLMELENNSALIDWEGKGFDILGTTPDGGFSMPGKTGEFDKKVEDAFWETHVDTYGLLIDGVDHSETWRSCYESSGYTDPYRAADPTEELKTKQQTAEVTNKWIACARENGMADLKDVTAAADGWKTTPNATIPLSTTVPELRSLLAACPSFDKDQAKRQREPDFDWEKDYVPFPAIIIQPPPGVDSARQLPPASSATESPEFLHFVELTEALDADLRAFTDSLPPDPAPAG